MYYVLHSIGRPLPRLLWWRDGRVIDDTFSPTDENTVRNDLLLPVLSRQDFYFILICEASNSNLTQSLSTSVIVEVNCEFFSIILLYFNFVYYSVRCAGIKMLAIIIGIGCVNLGMRHKIECNNFE